MITRLVKESMSVENYIDLARVFLVSDSSLSFQFCEAFYSFSELVRLGSFLNWCIGRCLDLQLLFNESHWFLFDDG